MPLNHTIRLYNEDFKTAIEKVIENERLADIVIMAPKDEYLIESPETNLFDEIVSLGEKLILASYNNTAMYCMVQPEQIWLYQSALTKAGYTFRNIITAQLQSALENETHICNVVEYNTDDTVYCLYFTAGKGRSLAHTDIITKSRYKTSNIYPANWGTWFKGTIVDFYRTLMRISSEHTNTVLDPFMTVGDIGVASVLQDRRYIGIEPDRAIFNFAKTRIDTTGD